jgi:hypothetical protein
MTVLNQKLILCNRTFKVRLSRTNKRMKFPRILPKKIPEKKKYFVTRQILLTSRKYPYDILKKGLSLPKRKKVFGKGPKILWRQSYKKDVDSRRETFFYKFLDLDYKL